MKIMNCPLNGPAQHLRVRLGRRGEADAGSRRRRGRDWARLRVPREQHAGVVREWWCHVPTNFWFIAERNTVTDEIIRDLSPPASSSRARRVRGQAEGREGRDDRMNRLPAPAGSLLDREQADRVPASRAAARGLRRRHHRQRARSPTTSGRPVALVQVSPPARHPHHGRAGRQHARAGRRRAERAGRSPSPSAKGWSVDGQNYSGSLERDSETWIEMFAPLPAGRLLLQGLLPPEGRLEVLGAVHPQACRPRLGRTRRRHHGYYDKEYLFADVLSIGGGPAGAGRGTAGGQCRRRGDR